MILEEMLTHFYIQTDTCTQAEERKQIWQILVIAESTYFLTFSGCLKCFFKNWDFFFQGSRQKQKNGDDVEITLASAFCTATSYARKKWGSISSYRSMTSELYPCKLFKCKSNRQTFSNIEKLKGIFSTFSSYNEV